MFDYLTELGLPEEVVSFFFTFFIGAIAVSAVIGIAIYLLESISVYKMAKSAEIKNPWLVFIPVANDWVFGTLAEKYKKKNGTKSARFGIILPVLEGIVLIESIALTIFTVISIKEITGYALDAVNTLKAEKIVNGDQNNNFNPLANTTRAEAAVIIYNVLSK